MQKDKTLQFWDDFYRKQEAVAKEWIVQPSDVLLQVLLDQLPATVSTSSSDDDRHSYRILEIGCGTSSLAADLCEFWERQQKQHQQYCQKATNRIRRLLHVMSTDVSPVCIEEQKKLQQAQCQTQETNSSGTANAFLEYRVLNITEPNADLHGQFDLILDKGCLDTCLFRSKKADQWVKTVLNHIHSWLSSTNSHNSDGVYVIVTPRSKLKVVREHPGFVTTRSILTNEDYGCGDLEPRSNSTGAGGGTAATAAIKEQRQYMYICRRVDATHTVCANGGHENENDFASCCASCGVTFAAFCEEPRKGRTVAYWTRHWLGHQQHCKMSSTDKRE